MYTIYIYNVYTLNSVWNKTTINQSKLFTCILL